MASPDLYLEMHLPLLLCRPPSQPVSVCLAGSVSGSCLLWSCGGRSAGWAFLHAGWLLPLRVALAWASSGTPLRIGAAYACNYNEREGAHGPVNVSHKHISMHETLGKTIAATYMLASVGRMSKL